MAEGVLTGNRLLSFGQDVIAAVVDSRFSAGTIGRNASPPNGLQGK
jgi:hypothetical protein